jgi:hypothetical protein
LQIHFVTGTLESYSTVIYIDIDFFSTRANHTLINGGRMRTTLQVVVCLLVIVFAGCSPLLLRPADFSWPVEVALKPDGKGNVQETRYQVSFNVKALLFEELKDSVTVTKYTLHILRDYAGYYFITAKGFKNVYVFGQGDGSLKLEKKILVAEKGLEAPALNQKTPYIHLINEDKENEPPVVLTKDGIIEGGKK